MKRKRKLKVLEKEEVTVNVSHMINIEVLQKKDDWTLLTSKTARE